MIGTILSYRLRWVVSALALAAVLAVPAGVTATRAARPAAPVQITYWYPWGGDSKTYEENRAKTSTPPTPTSTPPGCMCLPTAV